MSPLAADLLRRSSSSSASTPTLNELDNQLKFYERIQNQFLLELDKTSALARSSESLNINNNTNATNQNINSLGAVALADSSSTSSTSPPNESATNQQAKGSRSQQLSPSNSASNFLLQKRHSTSYEQKFFANLNLAAATAAASNPRLSQDSEDDNVILDSDNNSIDESSNQASAAVGRRSIAQQLLDLHEYTGEVVGGSPLSLGANKNASSGNLSLSRSSSRSSSVSSMMSSTRKSASIETDVLGASTSLVPDSTSPTSASRLKQSSFDGMFMLQTTNGGASGTGGLDSSISSSSVATPTTIISCLVPTIVVHQDTKQPATPTSTNDNNNPSTWPSKDHVNIIILFFFFIDLIFNIFVCFVLRSMKMN